MRPTTSGVVRPLPHTGPRWLPPWGRTRKPDLSFGARPSREAPGAWGGKGESRVLRSHRPGRGRCVRAAQDHTLVWTWMGQRPAGQSLQACAAPGAGKSCLSPLGAGKSEVAAGRGKGGRGGPGQFVGPKGASGREWWAELLEPQEGHVGGRPSSRGPGRAPLPSLPDPASCRLQSLKFHVSTETRLTRDTASRRRDTASRRRNRGNGIRRRQ